MSEKRDPAVAERRQRAALAELDRGRGRLARLLRRSVRVRFQNPGDIGGGYKPTFK